MAYSGYTPDTAYTRADDLIAGGDPDSSALQQLMALTGREQQALPISNILRWMGSRPSQSRQFDFAGAEAERRRAREAEDAGALRHAALQQAELAARPQFIEPPKREMVGRYVAPVGGVMNSIGGYVQASSGTPGARAAGWVDRRDQYEPSTSSFSGPMGPSRARLGPDSGQSQAGPTGPTSFKLSPGERADFSRQTYGYGRPGVKTNVAQSADYSGKGQPDDDEEAVQELINLYRGGGRAR